MENKTRRQSKYSRLYHVLAEGIRNGTYATGSYLPPERNISENFGVGRVTVRSAMELLEQDGMVRRVRGAGNMVLGFPDADTKNGPRTILFVLSGDHGDKIRQPFVEQLFHSMEQECRQDGYALLYISLNQKDSAPDMLTDKSSCSGIVFVSAVADKFMEAALAAKMPAIPISGIHSGVVNINPHNVEGSFDATEYLILTGSSKIAFISGIPSHHNARERLLGYRRALLCNGFKYDEGLVCRGDWDFESGYACMRALLEGHGDLDGVVSANDMMACGALRALAEAGRNVPGDVQVIGFDNVEQGIISTPTLSTVGIDSQFTASMAVSLIEAQQKGQKPNGSAIIPVEIVLRDSTRRKRE